MWAPSLALLVCVVLAAEGAPVFLRDAQDHGLPRGVNETYGYPDGAGALIIEGPFPYKNGPSIWSDKTPWGASALVAIPGSVKGGKCEAVPKDSPFYHSTLKPVPFTNGAHGCLVGCNISDVAATNKDPCKIGSVMLPLSNSPMSCFDVGPGFAGGWGLCGYNCTALEPHKKTPCTDEDRKSGNCSIDCNSRGFPPSAVEFMRTH